MQLNAPGKIFIFQSKQACFLTGWSANIISRPTLFKRKQSKKIPIVDQTHGLTPFEKISIGRLGKLLIFKSRQACFLTGWSGNIISRPILLKSKQRKKFQFLTKVVVNPFKKYLHRATWSNPYFSVQVGLFSN